MKFRAMLLVAVALSLVLAGTAYAATWQTVVSKSGSGAFTVKSFSRTINTPNALRLFSKSTSGTTTVWSIACSRNFSIWSRGGTWNADAGRRVKRLPMMENPDSCVVTAAFGTRGIREGSFTLKLQKRV